MTGVSGSASEGVPFTRLEDAQRFLEQRAYEHFRASGEWPRARDFDLDYHHLLDPLGGLQMVCKHIGTDRIWCGSPASENDRITLRWPALIDLKDAADDISNFLAAVRLGAERYHSARGNAVQLKVADLVANLNLDELAAKRVLELILQGNSISSGGGGGSVTLTHQISRMREVTTLEDYLARVEADVTRRQAIAQYERGDNRPAPHPPRRIFLSHAKDDAALAHHLADVIRQGSPAKVFVASKAGDIPTGSDWLDVIEKELTEADTYLLLLTPFSVKRFWLWYESGAAWMSDRPFVPVTAAGLAKADVPYPLGARQVLSLDDPADVAQLGRDLGAEIADPALFCETVHNLSRSLPWRASAPPTPSVSIPLVAASPVTAGIRVTMRRRPDEIVLTNEGSGPVREVNLILDEPKNPILEAERDEKLPVPMLEPGQSCPLLISLTMGRAPPYHGVLEWVENDGQPRTREVHIYG